MIFFNTHPITNENQITLYITHPVANFANLIINFR